MISGSALPNTEFGSSIRQALTDREAFLETQGLARRSGQRMLLAQNLLTTLRDREIAEAVGRIEAATHLSHRPTQDGVRVSGTYRESVQLASGRFAMLDDGVGFSLVPWRPVIEKRLGHERHHRRCARELGTRSLKIPIAMITLRSFVQTGPPVAQITRTSKIF